MLGKVAIEGVIGAGASGTTIFTLPAGYRPTRTTTYTALAVSTVYYPVQVTVASTGEVQVDFEDGDLVIIAGDFWLSPPEGTPAP